MKGVYAGSTRHSSLSPKGGRMHTTNVFFLQRVSIGATKKKITPPSGTFHR